MDEFLLCVLKITGTMFAILGASFMLAGMYKVIKKDY